MNTFENDLSKVVEEIESKLGYKLDLENETYVLQTPSAYIQIGIEENELKFHVTGGRLTYLETDIDIFENLYGNEDDYNEWISKEHDWLH